MSRRIGIERAIEALETQRGLLGDVVVDDAVRALVDKMASCDDSAAWKEERRTIVSVIFCDVIDLDTFVQGMDPEIVHEILNRFFNPWRKAVERYNGRIEKYIGDAVMAVFGIPSASEDDPERAVRAALYARDQLISMNEEFETSFNVSLRFRIGINTGTVMAGEPGSTNDFSVTGDTVNVASRIQDSAPVNGILISHDTYRHIRGVFDVRVLPDITVKGKSEPIRVYEVINSKPRAFRVFSRGIEGLETTTVGREKELRFLEGAWLEVKGDLVKRFVVISGEAGIGKSRLLYDFKNWMELRPEPFWLFQGRAIPEHRNLPYSLIRDLICFRFEIRDTDEHETRRRKLEEGVTLFIDTKEQAAEIAHFIGHMIGFDFSWSPHINGILHDPAQIRNRALNAFSRFFRAAAGTDPVVIYLEDLQWADQGSLNLLSHIHRACRELPILTVGTTRSLQAIHMDVLREKVDIFSGSETIELRALPIDKTMELLEEILRLVKGFPQDLFNRIVEQSEGNPFYLEEIVKMLIDQGVIIKGSRQWWCVPSKIDEIKVPSTLMNLLQARLDTLPFAERSVLQNASVVGRVFWDGIVAELSAGLRAGDVDNESSHRGRITEIDNELRSLCLRDFIRGRENSAFAENTEYIFHHALLHDVTYETVLMKHRRKLHSLTAGWLVSRTGSEERRHAGLVAFHFDKAGEPGKAIEWYVKAGEHAKDRFANEEALQYINKALELMEEDKVKERFEALLIRVGIHHHLGQRDEQKADLHELESAAAHLNDPKRKTKIDIFKTILGNAIGDYSMATDAAQHAISIGILDSDPSLKSELYLNWGETLWRTGDYENAIEILDQARSMSRNIESPKVEAGALRNLGAVMIQSGESDKARVYLQDALDVFRSMDDKGGMSATLNNLGLVFSSQRKFGDARRVYEQALDAFQTIGHRHGQSAALINLGMIANYQNDFGSALKFYGEALDISKEIGHRSNEALALNNRGFVLFTLGKYRDAMDSYEACLEINKVLNEVRLQKNLLINLGLTRIRCGEFETAFKNLAECIDLAEHTGDIETRIEAGVYTGHLYLFQRKMQEAEVEYGKASELVRKRGDIEMPVELVFGSMMIAHLRGDGDKALMLAERLMDEFPALDLTRSLEPMRVKRGCYEVLRDDNDPRADKTLKDVYEYLIGSAEMIGDEDLRRSYLENVPFNRAIVDTWSRIHKDDGPSRND